MNNDKKYVKVASYEPEPKDVKKVVLLYSGGLDTSVILKWIQDVYKAKVIALCIDIGQQSEDLEAIRKKALKLGAVKSVVVDAKEEFANHYISKGIKANASYQGEYHLSTPLGRPLLAKLAVDVAAEEGADTIAHGCTGKGNDQVRLEGTAVTLNPDIKIIAPVREWGMGRDEELAYAKKHGIPVPHSKKYPYSHDDNMWGVTSESGEIENPSLIPPLDKILQVCNTPQKAPNKFEDVTLEFVKGLPVALNGRSLTLAQLIMKLNKIAAKHAIGITHIVEDRIVGLKVRGVYEAPAAHAIIKAHFELEKYMSTIWENKFKVSIDNEWAHRCYVGHWYDPLMNDLNAFINKMNEKVNGKVTLRFYKGDCQVVSIKAPDALFDEKMATFMKSDIFNQNASPGFIELWTLQMRMAKLTRKSILITIGPERARKKLIPSLQLLTKLKTKIYATDGTSDFLAKHGIKSTVVYKISEKKKPNIGTYVQQQRFDLIINIPDSQKKKSQADSKEIRKVAVSRGIALVTSLEVAETMINKMAFLAKLKY